MLVGRKDAEGYLLIGGPLNLARGGLAQAVGVEDELHHHGRVVDRPTAQVILLVGRKDGGEIQAVHHVGEEPDEMSLGHPFAHVRGEEVLLIWVVGEKVPCHSFRPPSQALRSPERLQGRGRGVYRLEGLLPDRLLVLYLEDFYGERVRVPEDRHYDPERELWLLERDGRVVLGMTHAGVVLSGGIEDLVLEAEVGQDVAVGGQLLSVEAYKAAQDITSPLAGRLAAVNRDVLDDPELLDEDPYGAVLLLEVEPGSVSIADLAGFPTASDYLRGLESSCAATDEGGVTGGPDLGTAAGARVESAAGASREVGPCGETKRALVAHCSDPVALTRLASGMKVINLGARVW